MKKRNIAIGFLVIASLLAVVVAVLVIRRRKSLDVQKKGESIPQSVKEVVSSVVSGYVPETFPLKKGMKGENIKAMQDTLGYLGYKSSLGVFVVDGYFGDITMDVVRQYFKNPNKTEVSEAEWKPLYNIYKINNNLPGS